MSQGNEKNGREVTAPIAERQLSRRCLVGGAALVAPVLVAVAACKGAQASEPRTPVKGHGKAAIVTGSSRGIGAAIAGRLAQEGFSVMVNCVKNTALAAAVVREIESAGGRAIWQQADVSDPAAVQRLFEATGRAFGGVDVVVSNAGILRLAPFAQMTDEDFRHMVDVNLKGGFHTLREAARRVRDGGRIISLGSSITLTRPPTYGPYAGTKAALEVYANVLAKELQGRRISVNTVAPGVVNTTLFTTGKTAEQIAGFVQRTPHGRLGEPADIAGVIASLCADDGFWVNGQTIFANGGLV